MRGAIFESFMISEFIKARYNKGLPGNHYFWRDRSGNEVDLLIEEGDRLKPIEFKSGQTLNRDFFRGLEKWINLAGDVAIHPTLIYGGEESATYKGIRFFSWYDKACLKQQHN